MDEDTGLNPAARDERVVSSILTASANFLTEATLPNVGDC